MGAEQLLLFVLEIISPAERLGTQKSLLGGKICLPEQAGCHSSAPQVACAQAGAVPE